MQKFIQTYIIFKERVILRIVKLFFHNNLTDSNLSLKQNIINTIFFFNYTILGIKLQLIIGVIQISIFTYYKFPIFYDKVSINIKYNSTLYYTYNIY